MKTLKFFQKLLWEHALQTTIWSQQEGQRVVCRCGAEIPVDEPENCRPAHRDHVAQVLFRECQ